MGEPQMVSSAIQPPPVGVGWITVDEAARRSGESIRTLRWRCGEKWQGEGLARMDTPPGKKRPCWHVREDADDGRFGRVKFPDAMTFDVRTLTDAQRREYDRRLKTYKGWVAACAAAGPRETRERVTAEYLLRVEDEGGVAVSVDTLYEWDGKFRKSGPAGLVDGRWRNGRQDKPAAVVDVATGELLPDATEGRPMVREFIRLMFRPQQWSGRLCWRLASGKADEQGWPVVSYRTCIRAWEAVPVAVKSGRRYGRKRFEAEAEAYIERDFTTIDANGMWNADHHQFDVWVSHDGRHVRPWLTAYQDCRSRKIVGWRIGADAPDSGSIVLALRDAVKSHGVPARVFVDNGKDFDAFTFHGRTKKQKRAALNAAAGEFDRRVGIYTMLGIDARNVRPFRGQSKPIERFFRTVCEQFSKRFDTYCGNKPENRPDCLDANLDAGKAPTLAEFVEKFATWLEGVYHATGHTGQGMEGRTPADVFNATLGPTKRVAPDPVLDLMLREQSRPVKVTRNGVKWRGLTYGRNATELGKRVKERVVLLVDPKDVGSVLVFTLDLRFICLAASNRRVPINADREALKEATRELKHVNKVRKAYAEVTKRLTDETTDFLIDAARRKAERDAEPTPAGPPPEPPTLRMIDGPIVREMPRIERAMQKPLKVAVGAELSLADAYAFDPAPTASRRVEPEYDLERAYLDDADAAGGES